MNERYFLPLSKKLALEILMAEKNSELCLLIHLYEDPCCYEHIEMIKPCMEIDVDGDFSPHKMCKQENWERWEKNLFRGGSVRVVQR